MIDRALLPALLLALAGCAAPPAPTGDAQATAPAEAPRTVASAPDAPVPSARPPAKAPVAKSARAVPKEVRTRNAMFKLSGFDELPGWQQDDIRAGWGAFRNSCGPLQKRAEWRELCAASAAVPPTEKAMRAFFEAHFTVLRILNTDATPEGEVTGYFEPLLEGQATRGGDYVYPVLGVPRGLYSLDWGQVPAAQRGGIVRVRPQGGRLVLTTGTGPGTYALDLRRFVLDDRDRKLRLRLVDGAQARVEPYYTRAELDALGLPGGVDAPVLAWVNDPLALYAMQVQGSGRILMPDTSVLRVQYAEQNGHPFRPLRVVPKAHPVTRGAAGESPETFVIEGDDETPDDGAVVTRGGRPAAGPAQASAAGDPLVDELLKGARKPAVKPATPAAATPAPAPAARPQSAAVEPRRAPPAPARLNTDPSYVFFKVSADRRPNSEGPPGALGVPLTAGRSVAVDPRVTPLGYPMYLSAPPPVGSRVQVQRLVFAQDTGGAIRGALRADYFWGFGAEAGQMARSTRHRGQMWVMLPNAEAARLSSSRLVTRGASTGDTVESDGQCLVDDGEFCSELPE
jgi:membrane-bound lytic murein transglycosylase A